MKRDSVATKKKTSLTLNFLYGNISSFHPHDLVVEIAKQALAKWMFEGLTRLDLKGDPKLAGAENIELSPCKKQYFITLRPNFYSDGTPVLAQDYEKAWKSALSLNSKCAKSHLLYSIKNAESAKKGKCSLEEVGVKALDEKTLFVELEHPTPYFLELLSFPIFFPFKEGKKEILGNGPYMLDSWEKEHSLTLKVNPFFWALNDIQIRKVHILMVKDQNTAFCLYEKGEIDFVGDTLSSLPQDTLPSIMGRKDFHKQEILRPCWLYLNDQYFPFSSPLIRSALSSSIDRILITEHILIGNEPLYHPLPKPISSYQNPVVYQNPIAEFEDGLKELNLNRETFPPLTLTFPNNAKYRRLSEYLRETWQSLFGIKVFLNLPELSTFVSEMRAGKYEMGGCFNALDYKDPLAPLERLGFSKNDLSKWENSEFKESIEYAKRNEGQNRHQAIRRAEEILKTEIPIIPIANQCIFYLCNPQLKGLAFNQSGVLDLRWAHFE